MPLEPLRIVKPSSTVEAETPDGAVTTSPAPLPSRIVTFTFQSRSARVASVPANPPYSPTPSFRVIFSTYGWPLSPATHTSSPPDAAVSALAMLRFAVAQERPSLESSPDWETYTVCGSRYEADLTTLGSRPEAQARAFSVVGGNTGTVTVSPETTTGSESVGSAPLVV